MYIRREAGVSDKCAVSFLRAEGGDGMFSVTSCTDVSTQHHHGQHLCEDLRSHFFDVGCPLSCRGACKHVHRDETFEVVAEA